MFATSALVGQGQSQSDEGRLDAALADLKLVEVAFSTDQAEYLPGEVVKLTLTAGNATSSGKEIPKAFADVNWFLLFRVEPDGKRTPSSPGRHCMEGWRQGSCGVPKS